MVDTQLLLFVAASLVVIVAPGPDNILVLTRGVTLGRGAAMASAAGASVGLVCHSVLAAVGLSAVLSQSAVAFSAIKYLGAAYLIFLGVKALLSREGFTVPRGEAPAVGLGRVFAQGVTSDILNPKISIFFLAYLPQFAGPGASGTHLLALGLVFAVLTWIVFSGLGYFSGSVGDRLAGRPAYARALGLFTGGVFVALGLRLATTARS